MALDLSTDERLYEGLLRHAGHKITCVSYGGDMNVAIECITCGEILVDQDMPHNYESKED